MFLVLRFKALIWLLGISISETLVTHISRFQELIASEPIPVDIVDQSDSESDGEEWMPEAVDANIGMLQTRVL